MKTRVVVLRLKLLGSFVLVLALALGLVSALRFLGASSARQTVGLEGRSGGETGSGRRAIETVFGRAGSVQDGVLKFTFPRSDLSVRVGQVPVEPGLALTSWGAFMQDRGAITMMGDLVLLESELEPVIATFVKNRVDVTALHNHLVGEMPRVMYLHYEGHGNGPSLAAILKEALSHTGTPLQPHLPQTVNVPAWTTIEAVFGQAGQRTGDILGFSFPRKNRVTERGVVIPPAMGLATSINFEPVGADVATSGDFVLVASEVNPVVRALTHNGIAVTAIHNHMLYESPRLFFLHFWGVGNPAQMARGLREALTVTNSALPEPRPTPAVPSGADAVSTRPRG